MTEAPTTVALRLEDGGSCRVPMRSDQWHDLRDRVLDLSLEGRDADLLVPVGDASVRVRLGELEMVWAVGR